MRRRGSPLLGPRRGDRGRRQLVEAGILGRVCSSVPVRRRVSCDLADPHPEGFLILDHHPTQSGCLKTLGLQPSPQKCGWSPRVDRIPGFFFGDRLHLIPPCLQLFRRLAETATDLGGDWGRPRCDVPEVGEEIAPIALGVHPPGRKGWSE